MLNISFTIYSIGISFITHSIHREEGRNSYISHRLRRNSVSIIVCEMHWHMWTLMILVHGSDLSNSNKTPLPAVSITKTDENSYPRTSPTSPRSPTLASSSPLFTLSYRHRNPDPDCQAKATAFVYQKKKLCDGYDPQNYLESKKAVFSCSQRCGYTPPYLRQGQEICACDAICYLHGDCCWDMSVACPKTYTRGKATYAYLGEMAYCLYRPEESSTIHSCKAFDLAQVTESSPENRTLPESFTLPYYDETEPSDLPTIPWTVVQLTEAFNHYKVADISKGVIIAEVETFKNCKVAQSVPYFIPKITPLECSIDVPFTPHSTSAIQIMKSCKKSRVDDAVTPFHRSCKTTQFVSCLCDKDQEFTDHIHNVCVGFNESVPLLSRHKLWNHQFNMIKKPSRVGQCMISDIFSGVSVYTRPHDGQASQGQTNDVPGVEIQLSISPVPASYKAFPTKSDSSTTTNITTIPIYRDTYTQRSKNNDDSDDLVNHYFDTLNWSALEILKQYHPGAEKQSWMFVLEISNTVERRLLCDSIQNFLSECNLLDCAEGAILWYNPRVFKEFGGYKCLVPAGVTVQASGGPVQLCWCMQILAVLSDVDIWLASQKIAI